ncbi:hypothetical protein F5B21DRAFT_381293 [Xylaria acuta]|nr:hypothetical protein F5B21DRAFT_381293 [Xylaria acuta]
MSSLYTRRRHTYHYPRWSFCRRHPIAYHLCLQCDGHRVMGRIPHRFVFCSQLSVPSSKLVVNRNAERPKPAKGVRTQMPKAAGRLPGWWAILSAPKPSTKRPNVPQPLDRANPFPEVTVVGSIADPTYKPWGKFRFKMGGRALVSPCGERGLQAGQYPGAWIRVLRAQQTQLNAETTDGGVPWAAEFSFLLNSQSAYHPKNQFCAEPGFNGRKSTTIAVRASDAF